MIARLDIDSAAAALVEGALVALPTDTVYGVGASIAHLDAVRALFSLKGRPGGVPLPVVAATTADAVALCSAWPDDAARLAAAFWPGALTLAVPGAGDLATVVGSATGRVGLRVPNHDVLRAVLDRTGPVALTSANKHREPPCVTADEVDAAFASGGLAGVLDSGRCDGAVSTVVEIDRGWRLAREGAIPEARLRAALAER